MKKAKKKKVLRHIKVDKKKKTLTYKVNPDSVQYEVFQEIIFDGFIELPKGFYKGGSGMDSPAGTFLVSALKSSISEKFKLEISNVKPSKVQGIGRGHKVILNFKDYLKIQEGLKEIRKEKNDKLRAYVSFQLGQVLPDKFEKTKRDFDDINAYENDRISKIVNINPDILDTLSKNDITTIAEVYQKLVESNKLGSLPKDIKIIGKQKSRSEKIYLEKVVERFESDIVKKHLQERDWQMFLSEFILLFNTSYIKVLEKTSVSLGGKYPDFMLIDLYNFIDIYEIKKPTTSLLKYDDSRDNYFWDTEISKAISQTENYIYQLTRNSSTFREDYKMKDSDIDVKVIRPRGFIIAGHSDQLDNEKKQNDFRLLSNSLKNIDIVLFDGLLNNLKNLLKRLQ